MADIKINDLTTKTADLSNSDKVIITDSDDSNASKNVLMSDIRDLSKPYVVVSQDGTGDYDGTTNTIIQSALDSISSTGGTVFIKAGTYNFSAHVNIYSNIEIIGEGINTILNLDNGANDSLLRNDDESSGNTNIIIRNLKINGNASNQTSFTGGLIHFAKGGDAFHIVENVTVINSFYKGIYMQEVNHCSIEGCYVNSCGANGIDLFVCNDCDIYNNKVIDVTDFVGILINRNSSRNKIIGNYIEDISDDGIQIRGYDGGVEYSENNIISNNTVYHTGWGTAKDGTTPTGQGIFLNLNYNRRNIISNNQVIECGINGIEVTVNGSEMTITGNTIITSGYQGNGTQDAGGEGFGIFCNSNGDRHIISNNTTYNCWRSGIAASSNCNITGNISYNNGQKGSGSQYGISFGANCSITGNNIFDTQGTATQTYGLFSTGNDNVITGNNIYDNLTGDTSLAGTGNIILNNSNVTLGGSLTVGGNIDARGYDVLGDIHIQNSSGLAGTLVRASSDIMELNMSRATTDPTEVFRFNVKNDGDTSTTVGSLTGGTNSAFVYQTVRTDLIEEKTSDNGIVIDGVTIKDSTVSVCPTISTGTAAPGTTPTKVGDMFVDTTANKIYVATGTASSADWTILN